MGRAKDLMMQEEERGWSFSDHQICSCCISEPYLKAFIKNSASVSPCSFCGRRGEDSVPLDDVMEIIGNTVSEYYNRAVNEAPYESAEGGYQGTTYDTYEVMDHIVGDISRRDDVLTAITESFDDDIWVERDMFSLSGVHKYVASWDEFCDVVKHRSRYFFDREQEDDFHETIPVPDMLDTLRDVLKESGLIRTLPGDLVIYRVRSHKKTEQCTTREALGPPPGSKAPSNRMSAAGISVFYGAFEMATAVIEASMSMQKGTEWVLTGAAWQCTRALHVLDLSELPPVPSIFATSRDERGALLFLREFVTSITAPVVHDGREHIEYVPTQILTEYFRVRVKDPGGAALDGIVYPSARRSRGRSIVLFASHDDLDPENHWGDEQPIVKIDPSSVKRLHRRQRKRSIATGTIS
jgi:HEPN/RES N-terminal domain 1/RES domain